MTKIKSYETLSEQLKDVKILSNSEIDRICSAFEIETINKNNFFIEAGKRCSKIGLLNSGILCSFIYDSEGSEDSRLNKSSSFAFIIAIRSCRDN